MTELYSLVGSLEPDEIKYINKVLKRNDYNEDDTLLLQKLFNLICENSDCRYTDESFLELIYQNPNTVAYSKLKSRLFHFILDTFCSDSILSRENMFDPVDKQIIRIRKKMIQFRILYRKRNRPDVAVLYHLLNEIIKSSVEYEQYDVLGEALHFKKYMIMIRKGIKEAESLNKQIALSEQAYKAVIKANNYYFTFITFQGGVIRPADNEKLLPLLNEAVDDLRKELAGTNSISVKYIFLILNLEYSIRAEKFEKAKSICEEILAMLKTHKVLNRKERMGFIYDNMSMCNVYCGDYKNAITNAQKAQSFYSSKCINYVLSMQQEFYSCFYEGLYNEALRIIDNMLLFDVINKGEFRHDKYVFLKACTLFKLDRTKEALKICNEDLKITVDKERWDLGIRYLKIMCLIKLEKCDMACNAIEALRKVINRLKSTDDQKCFKRDEMIFKAFNEFSKNGFVAEDTLKLKSVLQLLAQRSESHSWSYYSHEIIPVHAWLSSLLNKNNRLAKSKTAYPH